MLQERYFAFKLTDFLFCRSASFRNCVVENLDEILLLGTGQKSDQPLPPPVRYTKLLREEFKSMLKSWATEHGAKYKSLNLGLSYVTGSTGSEPSRNNRINEQVISRLDEVQRRELSNAARKTLQISSKHTGSMRTYVLSFRRRLEDSLDFPVFSMLEENAAEEQAERESEEKACNPEQPLSFDDLVDDDSDGEHSEEEHIEQFARDFGLPAANYSINVSVGGSSEVMKKRMTGTDRTRFQNELRTIGKHLNQLSEWEQRMNEAVTRITLSDEQLHAYQDVQKLKDLCQETLTRCQQVGLQHEACEQNLSDSECEMEEVNIFPASHVSPGTQEPSDVAGEVHKLQQTIVGHQEKRRKTGAGVVGKTR